MLAHTSRRSRALLAVASRAFATKPDALAPAPPVTPPTRGPPASSPASRTVTHTGQAFVGDLRSASALGLGDGITDHTSKWLQVREEKGAIARLGAFACAFACADRRLARLHHQT